MRPTPAFLEVNMLPRKAFTFIMLALFFCTALAGARAEARSRKSVEPEGREAVDVAVSAVDLDEKGYVRVTIKNKGTGAIQKNLAYTIFVNRIQVYGSFLQGGLAPGQTVAVGAGPAGCQLVGAAVVEAEIDPANTLGEAQKTLGNNRLKKKLSGKNALTRKGVRKK